MISFNKSAKFGAMFFIFLSFLLISTGVIMKTYSSYHSRVVSNSELKVAPWTFKLNGASSSSVNIDLESTIDNTSSYSDSAVVPGSSGIIVLNIDCTDTAVALDYYISVDKTKTNLPSNLKLFVDSSYTTEFESFSGFIDLDDEKIKELKIYWKWFYTEVDETETWSNKSLSLAFNSSAVQRIDGD